VGVETASFLAQLNLNWPLGADSRSQGDDHLRLIKQVLKTTFPGAGGLGLASAINVTEDEFNFLSGVTSPIQSQLSNATFPAGTVLPFYQAAPPPGWTLVDVDNFMLRAVNTSGGTSGGTDSPILNDTIPSHTHTISELATDTTGAHIHTTDFAPYGFEMSANIQVGGFDGLNLTTTSDLMVLSAGAHSHTITGGTIAANVGAANWAPKYLNMILCSKS